MHDGDQQGPAGPRAGTYRVPLILEPQPEGGYTVTSPLLPELITEGDTVEAALTHAREAFTLVLEMYQSAGSPLPAGMVEEPGTAPIRIEQLIDRAS